MKHKIAKLLLGVGLLVGMASSAMAACTPVIVIINGVEHDAYVCCSAGRCWLWWQQEQ